MLVIESEDCLVQRTASLQKNMLQKEYIGLLDMGQELLALVSNVPGIDTSEKDMFNCDKEKLSYRQTLTSLEKVIKKIEAEDSEKLARAAPVVSGDVVGSAVCSHPKHSNIVKIKVSAPKFSGSSREFAVFKRDFNAIVAVDSRNAVEIGALLKESIPPRYKYLLDRFDLSEHEKMMGALTEKFGRARIIVDECTSEIKQMKKLTNDSEFITFVDHLDKLKQDLSQLGLLSDVANMTVISEIEAKLPTLVQRDWIKVASSKNIL